MSAARQTRFNAETSNLTGNRFLQLKKLREEARKNGQDALLPRDLSQARDLVGTCLEMCPEFEREEREYQNNVDKLEYLPGTRRIDPTRAVKAYHRSAAGNEQPPPQDVRPPAILQSTLDYLFHVILTQDPTLLSTHPFLRDRTRAIRQDFVIQHVKSSIAVECHERIARFHIYCLHCMRGREGYSESQELEQLRKVLQTLTQFYDDARHTNQECPNQAEFRAYYLLTHLRDPEALRTAELLPPDVFHSHIFQLALRLQSLVQRNNISLGPGLRGRQAANSEACLNSFARFFRLVEQDAPFLFACMLETEFHDIRRGALKAMRRAYIDRGPQFPLAKLVKILGLDDEEDAERLCAAFSVPIVRDAVDQPVEAVLNRKSTFEEFATLTDAARPSQRLVESKRGNRPIAQLVDEAIHVTKGSRPRLQKSHIRRHDSALAPPAPKLQSVSAPTPSLLKRKPLSPVASTFSFIPSPTVKSGSPKNSAFAFAQPSQLKPPSMPAPEKDKRKPVVEIQPVPSTSKVKLDSPPSSSKAFGKHRSEWISSIALSLASSVITAQADAASFLAATTALAKAQRHQDQAEQVARCSLFEQIAAEMIESAVDQISATAALSAVRKRHRLRRYFCLWREALASAMSEQTNRALQLRQIRHVNRDIGKGSRESPRPMDIDLDDLKIGPDLDTDQDALAFRAIQHAAECAQSFWERETLAREIVRQISGNRKELARLEVIILVGNVLSTEAFWYRAKFGFEDIKSNMQRLDLGSVDITIRIVDPTALMQIECYHIAFILVDLHLPNLDHAVEARTEVLLSRCRQVSEFATRCIVMTWPDAEGQGNEPDIIATFEKALPLSRAEAPIDLVLLWPASYFESFRKTFHFCLSNIRLRKEETVTVSSLLRPVREVWHKHLARITSGVFWLRMKSLQVENIVNLFHKAVTDVEQAVSAGEAQLPLYSYHVDTDLPSSVSSFISAQQSSARQQVGTFDTDFQALLALANFYQDLLDELHGNIHVLVTAYVNTRLDKIAEDFDYDLGQIGHEAANMTSRKRKKRKSALGTSHVAKQQRLLSNNWLPERVDALSVAVQETRSMLAIQ